MKDLLLHRDIQRAGRLVTDQNLRLYDERAGDRRSLTLTTAYGMRLSVRKLFRQTAAHQQFFHSFSHLLF